MMSQMDGLLLLLLLRHTMVMMTASSVPVVRGGYWLDWPLGTCGRPVSRRARWEKRKVGLRAARAAQSICFVRTLH